MIDRCSYPADDTIDVYPEMSYFDQHAFNTAYEDSCLGQQVCTAVIPRSTFMSSESIS